jgi:hypothetical protein
MLEVRRWDFDFIIFDQSERIMMEEWRIITLTHFRDMGRRSGDIAPPRGYLHGELEQTLTT